MVSGGSYGLYQLIKEEDGGSPSSLHVNFIRKEEAANVSAAPDIIWLALVQASLAGTVTSVCKVMVIVVPN